MATYTQNYNFEMPADNETADIEVVNQNMVKIDTEIKRREIETSILTPKSGSTANAIVLDMTLTDKKKGSFLATSANTGNMTINGKAFKKDALTQIPASGVKAGKVYDFYYDQVSDSVFILAKASGNATPSDVLSGKTYSNDDGEQTGTMTNNGSVGTQNLTSQNQEYSIPAGYHNGLGKVKAIITNLIASVIKAGATVGGIVGTFTADATATASQMLSGITAYVNGVLVTGNIPSKSAATYNPSTAAQTIAAGQYLSGIQTLAAVTGNATVDDVASGKIFSSAAGINLTGTNTNKKWASGVYPTVTCAQGSNAFSIALTFVPSTVVIVDKATQYSWQSSVTYSGGSLFKSGNPNANVLEWNGAQSTTMQIVSTYYSGGSRTYNNVYWYAFE